MDKPNAPIIAYLDVADPRLGADFHNQIIAQSATFLAWLKKSGVHVVTSREVISTQRQAQESVAHLQRRQCCGIVIRTAWFHRSNVPVTIAQASQLPCLLTAFPNHNDTGFEGLALAHGALDEVGLKHSIHFGGLEADSLAKTMAWVKACYARQRFAGSVYGEIGGRSLEMLPASSDYNQIRKIFGVHVDTLEQRELIHRSDNIPAARRRPTAEKWRTLFPNIQCRDVAFEKSVNIYLAGRDLFQEKHWSFAGIQCQPDMIDNYLAPCLPVAMWNEEGFAVSCENDINNALGMYLVQCLIGRPSMFADIFHLDRDTVTIHALNCGTGAPSLAGGPSKVVLKEQTPLQGTWDQARKCSRCQGGACLQFTMPPADVTIIRFGRINGEYVLHLTEGETIQHEHDPSELQGIAGIWPFAYIRLRLTGGIDDFIRNLRSHHAAIAPARCAQAVKAFADLLEIRVL